MSEPTITSSIEVYPEWFSGRIFPKVQWEDQSIEKIINRYASNYKEELRVSFKNHPEIDRNTIEAICKNSIIYICVSDGKYNDRIIKNLSDKKLSPKNLEKYSEMLELMGKVKEIVEKYEQYLRNLTDKELDIVGEDTLDELLLQDENKQRQRFMQFLEKTSNYF